MLGDQALDDQRGVIQPPVALGTLAHLVVHPLHPVHHILGHRVQVGVGQEFRCHQVSNVLVDLVRTPGPGLIGLVETVRHQDEEAVESREVDGRVEIGLSCSWLSEGVSTVQNASLSSISKHKQACLSTSTLL